MTNELQNVLDEIKLEKDSKLLPENIKKGVKIFDITGTLEQGGASTDAPVKLFATEEEMQNSTGNNDGDLALAYEHTLKPISQVSTFTRLNLPSKIILDTAVDEDYNVSFTDTNGDGLGIYLSTNYFDCMYYTETDDGYVEFRCMYSSDDGITYTRGEFMWNWRDIDGDTVDFGIEFTVPEDIDPIFDNFMSSEYICFTGLFEYGTKTDTNKAVWVSNMRVVDGKGVYDIEKDPGLDIVSMASICEEIISHFNLDITKSSQSISFVKSGDNLIAYVGLFTTTTSEPYQYATSLSLVQDTSNNWGVGTYSSELTDGVYKVTIGDTLSYTKLPAGTKIPVGTYTWGHWKYGSISTSDKYTILEISRTGDIDVDSEIAIYGYNVGYDYSRDNYGETTKFYHAPTQLTVDNANELLPGIVGYGPNGVVTGDNSVYDNLDWSTDIVVKTPTDVFLEYHNLPTRYSTGSVNTSMDAGKPNLLFGIKDGDISTAVMIGANSVLIKDYAKTIVGNSTTRNLSSAYAIYDNKLIWGYLIGSATETQSLYLVYYDYTTKSFGHILVADNLTNVYANGYCINFITDEKDGSLCICSVINVDNYVYSNYNSLIYKWCSDGTFKRLFYNSFNNFDTDITPGSTSSTNLYSCGAIVYDDIVYLGYYRYSTNCYTRLVKIKDGVRTNIIAYTSTGLDYMPRFCAWFNRQRMYIEGNVAYFINYTNTAEYLATLDLSTGIVVNLHTLSYNYYAKNRAYNTKCFYKHNDNLYFCISYATTSSSSSSSEAYAVQVYKYNITNNTIANLGYADYDTSCRGDEGGRLVAVLEGDTIYFECAYSTIAINTTTDKFTVTTSNKLPSLGLYYPYTHNGITYCWSTAACILLEHKTFTNTTLDGLVFVSSSEDTSTYALFNLDMDNQYDNTITPTEYTEAVETVNEILGEEV